MKQNTKEVGGGIVGATVLIVLFIGIIIGIMFLWSPVSFYLSKWSSYWDESSVGQIIWGENEPYSESTKKRAEARIKAARECEKRAEKFFGVSPVQFSSYASSTDDTYEKYVCYAIKFTEIPE